MSEFETILVSGAAQRARLCVVIVAYNRPDSLQRVLASLQSAQPVGEPVDLLVSIDGSSSSEEMAARASQVSWKLGGFSVRRYKQNLGLRSHVIACGSMTTEYEAVIVLEDDLVVGSQFLDFARGCVDVYGDDERIAGISLYAPQFNEMAELSFEPAPSTSSVYALQSAQSWGQVWTAQMWQGFMDWYPGHGADLPHAQDMPERIYSWPKSSWKKFAMKYLADTGKTWIYPYRSHTTNFSDLGTHNPACTSLYQVALTEAPQTYIFPALDSLVAYDIFFEREFCETRGRDDGAKVTIFDLYGTRPCATGPGALATSRILARKPSHSYGLALRPHEANDKSVSGNDIRVYELSEGETISLSSNPRRPAVEYYVNAGWREALKVGLAGASSGIRRRLLPWRR